MRDGNVRVREKFELSLDGRQVAAVVVVALVVVGAAFVLGLNVGRQLVHRQYEVARAGDLDALDALPATAGDATPEISFFDRLPKGKPSVPPPLAVAARPPAPAAAPAPAVAPEPALAAPAAIPSAADAPVAAATDPLAAQPPPPAAGPSPGAFAIQLAASSDRAEAERLAGRFRAAGARVEPADVPGKGRVYRVRIGGFAARADAERRLAELGRDSGAKGYVAPAR